MIINAIKKEKGGFVMPSFDGLGWLCASPDHQGRLVAPVGGGLKGQLRPELAGARGTVPAFRTTTTDVYVPVTGIPAWSPPI